MTGFDEAATLLAYHLMGFGYTRIKDRSSILQRGYFGLEFLFHPTRRWRFDAAFRGAAGSWAIEVDGGAWTRGRHTRGKGFIADMEKLNQAALLGWKILRFTPHQISCGEDLEVIRATGGL
jgi:hypothetical protein